MKLRMDKIYNKIFKKPPAVNKGRSRKKGRRASIPSKTASVATYSKTFLDEEKALFLLYPKFIGFEKDFLLQYSPLPVLVLPSASKPSENQTDEGYNSTTASIEVLQNTNSNSLEAPFSDKDLLPENFDLEFIPRDDGSFTLCASSSALQCLSTWDEQIAQRFNKDIQNYAVLPTTSAALPTVADSVWDVNKIEKCDEKPQILCVSEMTSLPTSSWYNNYQELASGLQTPPLPLSEFEMDKKFAEILEKLELHEVDGLDPRAETEANYSVDMNSESGIGINFWKDLANMEKDIKIAKIIQDLELLRD